MVELHDDIFFIPIFLNKAIKQRGIWLLCGERDDSTVCCIHCPNAGRVPLFGSTIESEILSNRHIYSTVV